MDLKNKSPIFNFYNETITGLIQIKILNRRKNLMFQFSKIVNDSIRASTSFDLVSRGFGFYAAIIALILMFIGLMTGIYNMDPNTFGLYGVTILFLIGFS
jgi:ATP-binding cassette subfamily C (CFTR/MRP) protein 4